MRQGTVGRRVRRDGEWVDDDTEPAHAGPEVMRPLSKVQRERRAGCVCVCARGEGEVRGKEGNFGKQCARFPPPPSPSAHYIRRDTTRQSPVPQPTLIDNPDSYYNTNVANFKWRHDTSREVTRK